MRPESLFESAPAIDAPPRDTENLLQQMTSALPQVLFLIELTPLRPLFVSPSFAALTGRSIETFYLGPSAWSEIVHPEDLARLVARLPESFMGSAAPPSAPIEDREIVFRILRADGAVRFVRATSYPIQDADVAVGRRAGFLEDITDRLREEQSNRSALELHKAVLAGARLGIAVYDRELRCRVFNPCFAELTGVPAERILGKPPSSSAATLGVRLALTRASLESALNGTATRSGPLRIGAIEPTQPCWIDIAYEPLRNHRGEIMGVLAIGQDVTAQILAEETLRTAEQNFRNLAEQAPDGIAIFKGQDTLYVNQRLLELVGYEDPAELLDHALIDSLFAPPDRVVLSALCQRLHSDDQPAPPWNGLVVRRDGATRHVECRLTPTIYDHKSAHLIIMREYQERERTEALTSHLAEAREQRSQLAATLGRVHGLSRNLLAAQEAQTRRLSRELHDDVGQLVTALKLYLDRLQTGALIAAERETLDTARQIALELVERVRRLSMDLRPTVLDDLGLVPALRWQFERLEKLTGTRVTLLLRGIEQRFSEEIEIAIFRIVQEGLCNVIRHARVREATVKLWCDGLKLGAQIEDRGVGFAVNQVLIVGESLGLSGMCERARQLGGDCTIESVPGRGTRVTVELPISTASPMRSPSLQNQEIVPS